MCVLSVCDSDEMLSSAFGGWSHWSISFSYLCCSLYAFFKFSLVLQAHTMHYRQILLFSFSFNFQKCILIHRIAKKLWSPWSQTYYHRADIMAESKKITSCCAECKNVRGRWHTGARASRTKTHDCRCTTGNSRPPPPRRWLPVGRGWP